MKCSICKQEIDVQPSGWKEGHNAQPVTNGRCCTDCNWKTVVPARLRQFFKVKVTPEKTVK
jgi:uncharacterized protein YbdZ (MbtH family)